MPEIILKNVTKRFDRFIAVDNMNMVIPDRSFVTLLGPSGCGKTTTLRMIAGLETPTEGQILIDGVTVFDADKGINLPPNKRDVGFLFQNYALWPHMTVYQNISFGLENLKWDKARIAARVDELCGMLKIMEFKKRYPSELSGGQQQRVAIARTLAPNPKVLFMDEPLSNLDAKLRLEMRTELKRLHVDTDSTFVYVTHDQLEAMTLSTRVCIMDTGVLQQYDPPLTMYARPANLFVADFLGNPSMNFLPGKAKKTSDTEAIVETEAFTARFLAEKAFELPKADVVLGVRPEYISIEDQGVEASVYSTLPAGTETTVRLKVNDVILTSVVFGGVDYPVDSKAYMRFNGANMVLFDGESKKNIAMGRLEV